MATRIAINGFGRIGRQVTKAFFEQHPGEFDIVAINDLSDVNTNAHLFKYDSNYGIFSGSVEVDSGDIVINGDRLKVLSERDPSKLPWGDLGVDLVITSTGGKRATGAPPMEQTAPKPRSERYADVPDDYDA
ncbi:MAG TPA: glyceraldehyde 3-phosphate dehydrogenase NAD-binding domain-containing protein [Caldilineaceae bacterium]|nr:glyceraldehyde 3-phosphate dehydrogenase NAD-binding domain-containing protein [Caldilineaceae bacterium]